MNTPGPTRTAAEIRDIERPLLAAGVPLMRRAASALAKRIAARLARNGSLAASRVVLLVGGGDNGGDALYAGAELAGSGAKVMIARSSERVHERGFAAAIAAGAEPLPDAEPRTLAGSIAGADAIVDGVLGIGAGGVAAGGSPALRGRARELVTAVSRACEASAKRPLIVAVDLPSGIDPDSGEVPDPDAVLAADLTVTFLAVKTGLVREPGSLFAGQVILEQLGVQTTAPGTPAGLG